MTKPEIEALVVKKEQELAERKKIEEFERRAIKAGVCPKCGSCDVYSKLYCNKSAPIAHTAYKCPECRFGLRIRRGWIDASPHDHHRSRMGRLLLSGFAVRVPAHRHEPVSITHPNALPPFPAVPENDGRRDR